MVTVSTSESESYTLAVRYMIMIELGRSHLGSVELAVALCKAAGARGCRLGVRSRIAARA